MPSFYVFLAEGDAVHVYMKDVGKTLQSLNELGSFITRE